MRLRQRGKAGATRVIQGIRTGRSAVRRDHRRGGMAAVWSARAAGEECRPKTRRFSAAILGVLQGKATPYRGGRPGGRRSRSCRRHPKARPSNCAAMVRAWPRQRSLIPSVRSLCRRGQRTRAATRCSRVQRPVSTAVLRDRSLSAPMRFHTDPDNSITETDSRAASESIEKSRCSRLCSLGSFRKTAGNGLFCQRAKYVWTQKS